MMVPAAVSHAPTLLGNNPVVLAATVTNKVPVTTPADTRTLVCLSIHPSTDTMPFFLSEVFSVSSSLS